MIHKTAIVDKRANISEKAIIGPYCIIGPDVQIGEGTEIQSHVNITGHTTIGNNTKIFTFASIGTDPQDLKYKGEQTKLKIGNNNVIREHATINKGTVGGGGVTKIGNDNLIMIGAHIAHDCKVGNKVVIANSAAIAGHAQISDEVIIGGNCGIQQFTRVGKMAMIGGMTAVSRDVIPYGLSFGNRNYLEGINLIGLRRKKISNKEILALSEAYKEIFNTNSLHENLTKLSEELKKNSYVKEVIDFINHDKKRPICTPLSK